MDKKRETIFHQSKQITNLHLRVIFCVVRCFVYAPNFGKVEGHIALGSSARPTVRPLQNLLRYSFEISSMDSSSKNN